jgi:hypothetical protein
MGISHRLFVVHDQRPTKTLTAVIVGPDHGQQMPTMIPCPAIYKEGFLYDIIVDRQRTVLGRIRSKPTRILVTMRRLLIPRRCKLPQRKPDPMIPIQPFH